MKLYFMEKKITFIPGWMFSADYCSLGEGINFWWNEIDFSQPIESEYLVGHSMGATVALRLWQSNKDKKVILVDPFIDQKSVLRSIIDWCRFALHEGVASKGRLGLKHFPRNIKKVFEFPEENYWEILKNISRENIKILHGVNDLYLCGKNTCDKFRELGFEVIEIPEAGHNWHKNFDSAILEIVERQ